jgi:hypothetical protein
MGINIKFYVLITCLLINFIWSVTMKRSSLMKPKINKDIFLKNNSDGSLNETLKLVNQTINKISVNSTEQVSLDRNVML